MKHNENLLQEIAREIEGKFGICGLSEGSIYYDFACAVAKEYAESCVEKISDEYEEAYKYSA